MTKYNIQIYSVKNSFEKNIKETLKALAEMGYDGVEFCDRHFELIDANELKKLLNFYGLTPVSTHVGYEKLLNNIDFYIDYLKEIECNTIICPWLNDFTKENLDVYAKNLEKISEKLIMNGISFGYHNHRDEFKTEVDNQTAFDYLIENSGMLLLTELDLAHIAASGKDPEEYIRKYAGRVTFLHLKQYEKSGEEFKTSLLNNGIVDIEKCVRVGKLMGCEHFIVEYDSTVDGELEDAKENIKFLKGLK